MRLFLIICLFLSASQFAFANNRDEFCHGFEEGYKSIEGDMVIVPICPIAPITPIDSTPFREGIKAGIAAALKD
jgi:hypothetical protein